MLLDFLEAEECHIPLIMLSVYLTCIEMSPVTDEVKQTVPKVMLPNVDFIFYK